jgi:hypothetical protein
MVVFGAKILGGVANNQHIVIERSIGTDLGTTNLASGSVRPAAAAPAHHP